MFQDWLNLYKKIRDVRTAKGNLICPECGNGSVDFQYVGDASERIGYVDMWCTACNKGVHLSRVSIPEGMPSISFDDSDEVLLARFPNYEPVTAADDE
jgi:hypothetical protein